MTKIYDTFVAGGIVMWPLLGLLVGTFACALERIWFWFKLIIQEKQIVDEVLRAARNDLKQAEEIAGRAQGLAIGRFLLAPLQLRNPTAQTFHLAVQAACDRELADMCKGDQLLESVMAIAPLLGILGTAIGLISAFGNLKTGQVDSTDISAVVNGIGQALIVSATGIGVAIIAFVFLRIFVMLRSRQMDYFSQVGAELELIFLQIWDEPKMTDK